jgi:hypothetical protein
MLRQCGGESSVFKRFETAATGEKACQVSPTPRAFEKPVSLACGEKVEAEQPYVFHLSAGAGWFSSISREAMSLPLQISWKEDFFII